MVTGTELFVEIMRVVDATMEKYAVGSRERKIREKLAASGYSGESLQQLPLRSLDEELRPVREDLAAKLGLKGIGIDLGEQPPVEAPEAPNPEYVISVQFDTENRNTLYSPLMTGPDIGDVILSDEYTFELNAKQDPIALIVRFDGRVREGSQAVLVYAHGVIRVPRAAALEPRGSKLLDAIVKDLMQYKSPPVQA